MATAVRAAIARARRAMPVRARRLGGVTAAALAVVFQCAAGSAADAGPAWRERYLATLERCRGADPAECRDSLLALRSLLPGHPRVVSALARAAARAGDGEGVVRALTIYADMGLAANPATDSTFVAFWKDPRFARTAARLARNAKPRARARLEHRMNTRDLLCEDVGYDPHRRRLLVSSIRRHSVIAIDAKGNESDLVLHGDTAPWGVYALGVDAPRRRLWLGTAATAESGDTASAVRGRAQLRCYDLDRGILFASFEVADSGSAHVFGDLCVAEDGSVYVTDSVGGGVYRARLGEPLHTLVAPGTFVSPQGSVVMGARGLLVLADYSRGLAAIQLASGSVTWLSQPADLATAGIDGLYAWRDRLVAIQNGVEPHRVMVLEWAPDALGIVGARVVEQASADLGEPNHATLIGDDLVLIGNSGWDRVAEDGSMSSGADARAPVLLRLKLRVADAGVKRAPSGVR